ncbi:MAG: RsmE family RNA methyltransferase [Phycisphaerales bacterium]
MSDTLHRRGTPSIAAPWIHVDRVPADGAAVPLDADAARHAAGARRLRDGDTVTLFDGEGLVADAMLVDRCRAARATSAPRRVAPAASTVVIAAALPKGDRAATMIDLATQLGMDEFVPLRCERSVTTATENGIARLERVAIEACKQSRRAWLPRFAPERTPAGALDDSARAGATIVLADGAGGALDHGIARPAARIVVLIGPEGGFAESEIAACIAAGAHRVSFGAHVLRIEAAVAAACAIVREACREDRD